MTAHYPTGIGGGDYTSKKGHPMSKRATKKAGKWVPKVGDKVRMTGTVKHIYDGVDYAVRIDGDYPDNTVVLKTALRPAVELFAWKPEKHTPKGAKKK